MKTHASEVMAKVRAFIHEHATRFDNEDAQEILPQLDLEMNLFLSAPDTKAALEKLVKIARDRNASGTHVDGEWMGVPDWEVIEEAEAALKESA